LKEFLMASSLIAEFSLHHVGYAVPAIELVTPVYVKRFGYEVCTPVIHDPTQTAYVQFLRLPGDRVFLELVAPDSAESKLSRAVRRGGALNHLCYSVEDIEAATARLREEGMAILSAPVPAVAFKGRRISWLLGDDPLPIELVERGGDL
jgi:methylmalonyl-CoA/ethylmalonyl-CoA epimerase